MCYTPICLYYLECYCNAVMQFFLNFIFSATSRTQMIIEYNIRTHGLMFRWESSLDYLETRWSREHKNFAWLKIKILVISWNFMKLCKPKSSMHVCIAWRLASEGDMHLLREYCHMECHMGCHMTLSRDILRIYKHISTLFVGLYKFECSWENLDLDLRYVLISYPL